MPKIVVEKEQANIRFCPECGTATGIVEDESLRELQEKLWEVYISNLCIVLAGGRKGARIAKVYCKNCTFAKWRRHLNSSQRFLFELSKCLNVEHGPGRRERLKTQREIVASFCKLGLINRDQECEKYQRKWWKFWV